LQERREDLDRSRLARAVRPEDAEHAATRDDQVNAGKSVHVTKGLVDTFDDDCVVGGVGGHEK
jgi:hypothetical protein